MQVQISRRQMAPSSIKKGALVKDNLVTGDDGSVTLKDLYLGTYTVTETKAPDNYVCKGESKTVELVYAGQTVEVQTGSATFLNERQKAAVRVEKQDEETKNPLSGGIYGLYAAEDIKVDGKTVVPKGTLIEKATTGADGKLLIKRNFRSIIATASGRSRHRNFTLETVRILTPSLLSLPMIRKKK